MVDNKNLLCKRNLVNILVLLAFVAALGIGAGLRLPRLDVRPVHGDEANQAVKTGLLLESAGYTYDPYEHHGPSLYYLTIPVLRLCGASTLAETDIAQYRAVTVLFGLLLIVLLWPMRDVLGPWGVVWAALFFAVSHAMSYYSRYYVQEMLLVCFTQASFVMAWRYLRRPGIVYAVLTGCCLGLVHATKETSALIAFSILAGIALALVYGRIRERRAIGVQIHELAVPRPWLHGAVACVAALLISVVLFSSFFTHWRGPLDSVLTYGHYLARAEGEGTAGIHDKPWYHYLHLLLYVHRQTGPRWSEALALFAGLAGIISILLKTGDCSERARHDGTGPACSEGGAPAGDGSAPAFPEKTAVVRTLFFQRFLVFYTLVVMILYALIPYKTPWNLLVFYHGILLLAGLGAHAIIRAGRWPLVRVVLCILLLAGVARMGQQSRLGNQVYSADTRNPYVYAHPSTALRRLIVRVDDIAAISEEGFDLHINVIRPDGDYWPLPWYFRRYTRVGWWHHLPERPDADIILAPPELYGVVSERLQNEYLVEFHALRPGVLLHAYIRQDLWDAFMVTRQ